MFKVVCVQCGRKFAVPEEAIGKRGKCAKCGAVMTIEAGPPIEPPPLPSERHDAVAEIAVEDFEDLEQEDHSPRESVTTDLDAASIRDAISEALATMRPIRVDQVSSTVPPEPSIYGAVAVIGTFFYLMGIVAVIVGLAMLLGALVGPPNASLVTAGVAAVGSGLPLIGTGALLLLCVDAARNLRAIRYRNPEGPRARQSSKRSPMNATARA